MPLSYNERDQFLAQAGLQQAQRQQGGDVRAQINENMFRNRPDLLQAEMNRLNFENAQETVDFNSAQHPLVLEGLQNARAGETQRMQLADPANRRFQARQDAFSQAQTAIDPQMQAARAMQNREAVGQERAMRQVPMDLATSEQGQTMSELDFRRKLQLTEAQAAGRQDPLDAMLMQRMGGGGGAAPPRAGQVQGTGGVGQAPPPQGGGLSEQTIRQIGASANWTPEEIESTIADARAQGKIR
jgi:hypothetical protein